MFIGFDEKKTSDHALHDRCAVTFFGGRNALVLLLKYSIWFHNRKLNIASVSRSSLGIALSEKPETRRRPPQCHYWWSQCQSCLRLFHTWVWYKSCGVKNLCRRACLFLFWWIWLIKTVMIVGFMNVTVMISKDFTSYPPPPGPR